jgi:hypothetical protein
MNDTKVNTAEVTMTAMTRTLVNAPKEMVDEGILLKDQEQLVRDFLSEQVKVYVCQTWKEMHEVRASDQPSDN